MKKIFCIACLLLMILLLPAAVSAEDYGNISVISTPSGATVFLDGISTMNVTPFTIINVSGGARNVTLTLTNYQDYINQSVTVTIGETQQVTASLIMLTRSLSISSLPTGSNVHIDNVYKGLTNLTVDGIQYGDRVVLITRTGYQDWSQTIKVNSSTQPVNATLTAIVTATTTPTPTPALNVTNGSVYFTSSPSSAMVFLNQVYKGTTSLTLDNITPGTYAVLIQKSGYKDWSSSNIQVMAGNRTDVNANLQPADTYTTVATAVPTTTVTTVKTTVKSTSKVPTPWPTATPTPASPVSMFAIIGAVGLGLVVLRKS